VGEISIGRTRKRRESNNQEREKEGKEKEQRNEIKRLMMGAEKQTFRTDEKRLGAADRSNWLEVQGIKWVSGDPD
jgi:hypothetical protein